MDLKFKVSSRSLGNQLGSHTRTQHGTHAGLESSGNGSQAIRPLVILLSHAWGGLEKVCMEDVEDQLPLTKEMRVAVLPDSPAEREFLQLAERHPQLKVITLDFRPRNILDFHLKKFLVGQIESGINLVHLHQPSLLGSVAPWLLSYPWVGLLASRHILTAIKKRNLFQRLSFSRLDSLTVMSEALKANVLATHAIQTKKVRVIPLGIDFDRFDPRKVKSSQVRKQWKLTDDGVAIGVVGRLDPAKGQDVFLRAAARLVHSKESSHADQLRFVIVGEETRQSDRKYFEELKTLAKQLQIEDRVVFSGFLEDIPSVMRALDICVMPSFQETFGLVAVEAMAMGTPVILSRGGSAREIVGNEEGGLLVRPNDAFDLQRAMRQLIDNEPMRKQMGEAGMRRVRAAYNRDRRKQMTRELYERIVRRRMSFSPTFSHS